MQLHITARRPSRWPSSSSSEILKFCSLSLILLVILVNGSEAIVKQQQQRSDDSQQANNGGVSGQSAYNNHQQQQQSSASMGAQSGQSSVAQQSSQPQQSYSSSMSVSSSAVSSGSPSGSAASQAMPAGISSQSATGPSSAQQQASAIGGQQQASGRGADSQQLSHYASYASSSAGSAGPKSSSSYVDNMAAAASNPEQSYTAAANSVNMALANSGVFSQQGPAAAAGGYGPASPQGSQSQMAPSSSSSSSSSSSGSNNQSPQSLNPLHYFYYPAKDTSSGSAGQAKASMGAQSAIGDSNIYQSMASNNGYPSYADQLNSVLSGMSSGPEAAASSQDPSYLPQPGSNGQMGANDGNQGPQLYNGQQQPQQNGQHQQQQHNQYTGDLAGYASNLSPSQQGLGQQQSVSGQQQQQNGGSSISFNGPLSNGMGGQQANEYMNSHMGGSGHQQVPPLSAYQSQLYNQMGDLSTSNFGNNAGGLSSVASYMSPQQQSPQSQHQHQQSQPQQHDLFGNSLASGGQQFSSAASQLSPSAVPPPVGGPANQGPLSGLGSSSLFSAASSLFGQQSGGPSASQQQEAANSLFSNQHYLNSFLGAQQFGQQPPQMSGPQSSGPIASGSSSAVSGSSSKRFGISSFIMPMLALAGLSLLIPTMSNIGTAVGRKKRSIEDRASGSSRQQQIAHEPMNGASQAAKELSIGEYMDKIERYYSIYKNAVENDDCLNRLICEFGDAVRDVTGKSAVVTVIEKLVPTWMTGKMHLFKEAALDHKEGKEKCKKYVCHSNRHN